MRVVTLRQGSPEWHDWRRGGLGGSDAPVVVDICPYRTRRQLFLEKTGQAVEDDSSKEFIFAQGHKVEGLIRKQFAEMAGVEMIPTCVEHDEFPHLRASLDGFDLRLGLLEAKLVGQAVLARAKTEAGVPENHLVQIQHQMAVTGVDRAQWFGHDGKSDGVMIEVRADVEFQKRLLDEEHAFWGQIKAGQIPPLSARDYLTPEDQTLLEELRASKELAENAVLDYDATKAKVLQAYKHPRIAGAGLKIFQVERRGSIDYLSIPEIAAIINGLSPEYLEKFRGKSSVSWTVKFDAVKKGAARGK